MKTKLLLLLIVGLNFGCSSTRIIAVWKDQETKPEKFSKIAVIAISSSNIYRLSFENKMVEELNFETKRAYSSLQMVPPMPKPTEDNREVIGNYFANADYDAILTISLLDDKEDTRYVPGESYVIPRTFVNPFGRYYYTIYQRVNTPGYYENSRKILIEANLYSVNDGRLLWSAQTKTVDPSSLELISGEYAKTLVQQLRKDGYLEPPQ